MFFATVLSSLHETAPELKARNLSPELCPSDRFSLDALRDYRENGLNADAALLGNLGLKCAWHGYFYSLDLASVDETIRDYSLRAGLMDLDCAAALGAAHVVLHSGYIPPVMDFLFDYWFDLYSSQMEKLLNRAQALGLTLLVENVFEADLRFPTRLMDRFGGALGLCLDAGHYAVHAKRDPGEWSALKEHIGLLHLHDNDGQIDRHWALGAGKIDFAGLFAALGPEPPRMTLELYGDFASADSSLAALRAMGVLKEGR